MAPISDTAEYITTSSLLCDDCYQEETGQPAECQDPCPRPPGHEGLCHASRAGMSVRCCTRCGSAGRLTLTPLPA